MCINKHRRHFITKVDSINNKLKQTNHQKTKKKQQQQRGQKHYTSLSVSDLV